MLLIVSEEQKKIMNEIQHCTVLVGFWWVPCKHTDRISCSDWQLDHHLGPSGPKGNTIRPRVLPYVSNDGIALTLYGFQTLTWKLVGWCAVPWSRSLVKLGMLGYFCAFHIDIFYDRLSSGLRENINALSLKRFMMSAWNLVGNWVMHGIIKQISYLNGPVRSSFTRSLEFKHFPW